MLTLQYNFITMIRSFFFSPSGTTKKVAEFLSKEMDKDVELYDITTDDIKETDNFPDKDIFLFMTPVYGGRIPKLAKERIQTIKGNGQKAIAVVVYGNRDYDDALLELSDLVKEQGFEIVGAAAFIAQHCIFPKVATNRPDKEDISKIKQFANQIKSSIKAGKTLPLEKIKGNNPYKKEGAVPIHPEADKKKCNECCTCIEECPTGAINKSNPLLTDKTICISCCRCINICPSNARSFRGLLYKIAGWKFVKDNTSRLEPEWFI